MASRLKPLGGGTKLARPVPVGSALKPPGGSPKLLGRPSPQPTGVGAAYDREGPPMARTTPVGGGPSTTRATPVGGQKRPVGQVRQPTGQSQGPPPPRQQAEGTSNGGTPNFKVGDNVLVGGVKPGVIAFIGTTHFATGVWAGIVLDSNDGKNSGSVKGVSYFQCEPNKGLFSKLDKLTLASKPIQKPSAQAKDSSSFETGDRVLVDGVKPGVVGFIGETQFARGIWVGIILDTPDGKNDGSVAGVQYFQCKPLYGLFSRLQKLVLVKKASSMTPTLSQVQVTVEGSSSTSEEGLQLSSQQSGPSPSELKTLKEKLKLGDYVLVGGAKEGILRFLGPTEFAKGIWAGVELPEPMGKNDGAVSGKRYFQCDFKHGLFAPLPKVERLASAADSVSTMSVGSSTSSMRLLSPPCPIPNPCGVGSVTIGTIPTESSSSSFEVEVQDDYSSSSQDSMSASLSKVLQHKEDVIHRLKVSMGLAESERKKHNEEITDLRRTVDDLQFRLLEQGVISGDVLEKTEETSEQQVTTLTSELEAEREKLKQLKEQFKQGGTNDSDDVHSKLVDTQVKLGERAKEITAHLNTIADLQSKLSASSKVADKAQRQSEKPTDQVLQKGQEVSEIKQQLDLSLADVANLQEQLKSSEDRCQLLSSQKADLKSQVDHVSHMSGDSSKQVTFLQERLEENEKKVNDLQFKLSTSSNMADQTQRKSEKLTDQVLRNGQEVSELKQQLDLSLADVANFQEQLKRSEDHCQLLSSQKADMKSQMDQVSHMSGVSTKQVTILQERLEEMENELEDVHARLAAKKDTVTEDQQLGLEEITLTLQLLTQKLEQEKEKNSALEQEINQTNKQASEIEDELRNTQIDLQDTMDLCSQHEALVDERNVKISTVEAKLRTLTKDQELWSSERLRLQSEQERITAERDRAIAECDHIMAQSADTFSEQTKMSQQRRELLSERDHLLSQQRALQTENEKLIGERDEVFHQLSEESAQRQEALQHLQEVNAKFVSTNKELTETLTDIERLRCEFSSTKDSWEHEKLSMREEIELASSSESEIRQRIDHASSERDFALHQTQELADRLDLAERDRDHIQLTLEATQGEVDELTYQMEDLQARHNLLEQETCAESTGIKQKLQMTENLLSEREREIAEAKERLKTLSDDLIASQGKHDQALLEEEKQLLEERVQELTIQLERAQEKSNSSSLSVMDSTQASDESLSVRLESVQSQLLETQVQYGEGQKTIVGYEQQIEFLNSVIADLQRKLETAEALSGLHGPLRVENEYDDDQDDDLPPPRLFCDICDVFDEHDTDDCPLQAASDFPLPSQHHGGRAPGGSDRPYCDTCEVFGHWSTDCEFDVTY